MHVKVAMKAHPIYRFNWSLDGVYHEDKSQKDNNISHLDSVNTAFDREPLLISWNTKSRRPAETT